MLTCRHFAGILLSAVMSGSIGAADPPTAVSFPDQKVEFAIPEGWKVVQKQAKKDDSYCLLQESSKEKIKATIAIWAGERIVKQAPSPAKGIAGGNVIAAGMWANRRVMTLAVTGRPPVINDGAKSSNFSSGKLAFVGWEMGGPAVSSWGVAADKREAGSLTVGMAAPPAQYAATRKVMEDILTDLARE